VEKVLQDFSTDENLWFSRELCSRHVIPDVQQAVCPQPAQSDALEEPTMQMAIDEGQTTMPAETSGGGAEHPLAPFFRSLGHGTWSRLGTLWIDAGRFSLVTIPCNVVVVASRADLAGLLRDTGRVVAVAAIADAVGVESSHFWMRDRSYSHASLQRQFRQQVVRGDHDRQVRTIPWDELRVCGLEVNRETMGRRGLRMHRCTTAAGWAESCAIAAGIPGLEATGCLVGDRLASFLVSWTVQGTCYGLIMHRDARRHATGAANALVYEFTRSMLARPGVREVTLGRGWFPPEPSIDRFKRHAGYVEEPLQLAIALHPRWEGLLRSSLAHAVLRGADAVTAGRLRLADDLAVLRAAERTRFSGDPDPPPGSRRPAPR